MCLEPRGKCEPVVSCHDTCFPRQCLLGSCAFVTLPPSRKKANGPEGLRGAQALLMQPLLLWPYTHSFRAGAEGVPSFLGPGSWTFQDFHSCRWKNGEVRESFLEAEANVKLEKHWMGTDQLEGSMDFDSTSSPEKGSLYFRPCPFFGSGWTATASGWGGGANFLTRS